MPLGVTSVKSTGGKVNQLSMTLCFSLCHVTIMKRLKLANFLKTGGFTWAHGSGETIAHIWDVMALLGHPW